MWCVMYDSFHQVLRHYTKHLRGMLTPPTILNTVEEGTYENSYYYVSRDS